MSGFDLTEGSYSGDVLYTFSKKTEQIQLNPISYAFLTKHKKILEKMNYFEWVKFLKHLSALEKQA